MIDTEIPNVIGGRETAAASGLWLDKLRPADGVFPAVFCGNAAVFKPSEHVPVSAHEFATLCYEAGLPAGVLNVVQGLGSEAGSALVEHPEEAGVEALDVYSDVVYVNVVSDPAFV